MTALANSLTALTEAMHTSDVPALKRLYTLSSSVKKFTEFRRALAEHVKVRLVLRVVTCY